MSLSIRHLNDICLLGFHDPSKTCRYLRNDELDASKWHCQKLIEGIKKRIDSDLIADNSPKTPSGDNCGGYLVLKNIVQGYDFD